MNNALFCYNLGLGLNLQEKGNDVTMKRCFLVMMLIALILLGLSGQVLAADTEWKLKLNADGTISESVSVDQSQLVTYNNTWKTSKDGGRVILTRTVPAWQDYMNQSDRLPLHITVKDYFLWQDVEIFAAAQQGASQGIFLSTQDKPVRLIIQLPGSIAASSAEKIEDGRTAIWQISKGADIQNKGLLVQATLVDGYIVSILLFVLGFAVIAGLFIRKISKTHKLIEEEYSLENIDREHLNADKEESKDAEDNFDNEKE